MNVIFGACIKVIAGFYLGCTGTVVGQIRETAYTTQMECSNGVNTYLVETVVERSEFETIKCEVPK